MKFYTFDDKDTTSIIQTSLLQMHKGFKNELDKPPKKPSSNVKISSYHQIQSLASRRKNKLLPHLFVYFFKMYRVKHVSPQHQ